MKRRFVYTRGNYVPTNLYASSGYLQSMILKSDGKLYAWGVNTHYELTSNTTDPKLPKIIGSYCDISIGSWFALSIDSSGNAWGWGYGANGRLGDGTVIDKYIPTKVYPFPFCKISMGNLHSLGLDKYGKAWGWGYNFYGQIGDGGRTSRCVPVMVNGNKTFCHIVGGDNHSNGIDYKGKSWGWGYNYGGVLGDYTIVSKWNAVAVLGVNKTFCQISSGRWNITSLDLRGKAWSWGYNGFGQLGNNTTVNQSTPVAVLGTNKTFCKIECGYYHVFGIDFRGKAWGWGYNNNGNLGDNSAVNPRRTPVAVYGNKTFCQISGGQYQSLGIDFRGKAWGWGKNNYGQIGDNSMTNKSTPVAVLGVNKTFCHISAGQFHSLGLDNNNKLWGWGDKRYLNYTIITPNSVYGNKTFCQIFCYNHSMGIDLRGKVWSWGYNTWGQLGDNTSVNKSVPNAMAGVNKTFCKISAGENITLGIDFRGKAWGWGYSGQYQIGNGVAGVSCTPVVVGGVNKTFCSIENSQRHSLGLDLSGKAWGWGYNPSGQVGDNTAVIKSTPVAVLGVNKTFCQIKTCGNFSSSALDFRGKVWCWGHNLYGQLGVNSLTLYSTPVAVLGVNKTFCKISGGAGGFVAIDLRGKSWAWGWNSHNELGIQVGGNKSTPFAVAGVNKTFCKISSKYYHTMAIDLRGKAWGWGSYNANGELGNNTTVSERTPVAVYGTHTFCEINVGFGHSIGIDNSGKTWAWGYNNYGQLGLDFYSLTPILISSTISPSDIFTGNYSTHSMLIKSNGQIWSWGSNTKGQLGDNTIVSKGNPVFTIGGNHKTFCKIYGSGSYSTSLDKYGKVWSWGYNNYGSIGDNTSGAGRYCQVTPIGLAGVNKTFCQLTAYKYTSLGIDLRGKVWGWGYNASGEIGDYTIVSKLTPVGLVGVNKTFCKITNGQGHTLGIDFRGKAWSWGYNAYGQLGVNSTTGKSTPTAVLGVNKTFCKIAASHWISIALDLRGKAWAWGNNQQGQLGNNAIVSQLTPVAVLGSNKTFCQISSAQYHSLGIDKWGKTWGWGDKSYLGLGISIPLAANVYGEPNPVYGNKLFKIMTGGQNTSLGLDLQGKAWSWGYNSLGQLGDNTVTQRLTPVAVLGINRTFCQILTGGYHTMGIDIRGKAWGWGYNGFGQLGDNTIVSKRTPIAVLGVNKTFCKISTGDLHTTGLDSNGKLWLWGKNTDGQLGDNTVVSKITPINLIGVNKTFCQISNGSRYSTGIDLRGKVWSWGYNLYGQLGNYTVLLSSTPVAVLGVNKTFCQISNGGGAFHNLGLDFRGKLWSWGYNVSGQLGIGSNNSYSTPVAVNGNKTFCKITSEYKSSFGLDLRGKAWGWGYNDKGQLGDTTQVDKQIPTAVYGNKTFCEIKCGYGFTMGLDLRGKLWSWGGLNNGQLGIEQITLTPVLIAF